MRQGDLISPLLFTIVANGLGTLLGKAKIMGLFRGFEVGRKKIEVSHL